jgi:hypothetical protein
VPRGAVFLLRISSRWGAKAANDLDAFIGLGSSELSPDPPLINTGAPWRRFSPISAMAGPQRPPCSSLAGRPFGFDLRCDGFLYSAFAETFRAFRGIDFTTRLPWLFNLLKPRAIAGGANNLSQNFKRSFHRDQSLKQNKS